MSLEKSGFRTIAHIGTVDASLAGSVRNIHAYITNDDAAGVETTDYFLTLYDRLKIGDVIFCSLDLDGTPTVRLYVVTASSASSVTIARETSVVTGDQTAIAALTENAGAIGGTNDGDLPDLSSPDAATNAAAIREVAAKLNALQAALVASGLLAAS
ncbi:hypothetical protein FMN63_25070 [Stappia sp. BW2]|uniref:hypothetical protein n=1 Tax=Stappia sp. BW2 TaxID=2592622 RepID=UPI0011DE6B54|nr:hypothetical protein [Stappia sp. BW2]TYC65658.1 hypothetical protein FMN63_25070 [Stappia sp. BW2]